MESIQVPSYAKINLGLLIKGKRNDGFHEIETLFLQVSLKDEIVLTNKPTSGVVFGCDFPGLPGGSANLCVRAAELLLESLEIDRGVEISLVKSIPVGAGLGGGSSNAATVLLGLNRLWDLNLGLKKLLELAVKLGSDVPFFIRGGTAHATGRGEILTHIVSSFDLPILIVYPAIAVSTKWAYEQVNLSLTIKKKSLKLASFKDINFNNVDFNRSIHNQFEDIVFPNYPVLAEIKARMLSQKSVFVGMSGSGSSIFGIFQTEAEALHTQKFFENAYDTFLVRPTCWGYASGLN